MKRRDFEPSFNRFIQNYSLYRALKYMSTRNSPIKMGAAKKGVATRDKIGDRSGFFFSTRFEEPYPVEKSL